MIEARDYCKKNRKMNKDVESSFHELQGQILGIKEGYQIALVASEKELAETRSRCENTMWDMQEQIWDLENKLVGSENEKKALMDESDSLEDKLNKALAASEAKIRKIEESYGTRRCFFCQEKEQRIKELTDYLKNMESQYSNLVKTSDKRIKELESRIPFEKRSSNPKTYYNQIKHILDYALDLDNPIEELKKLLKEWETKGWAKCEECGSQLIVVCEKEWTDLQVNKHEEVQQARQDFIRKLEGLKEKIQRITTNHDLITRQEIKEKVLKAISALQSKMEGKG